MFVLPINTTTAPPPMTISPHQGPSHWRGSDVFPAATARSYQAVPVGCEAGIQDGQ
ncbi:MAG: hypothetical protein HOB84_04750 [Candidatus Marinimicrobia bacterium]|nr:hypothetical protein [Candidatus Neomarinimicrobiota bacterium]